MTKKKITRIEGAESDATSAKSKFVIDDESIAKAKKLRMFSIILWIVAIGFEIGAILFLRKEPINMTWIIVLILADLACVITASILWKKSNRLNPASEKNKFRFFVQNQLGLIMSVIALLPLVILVFTNKNMTGKQKGIIGTIAVIALLAASYVGIDFNPPSVEQYQEQTEKVEGLMNGNNLVYWTKSGKSYHLFSDCSYINSDRTTGIFEGTVTQSRELKNITDLCNRCENKAVKQKALELEDVQEVVEDESETIE